MTRQKKEPFKTETREEASLLLYLETCAVDCGGRVNLAHMNADDIAIAKRWASEKHIEFGRIAFKDIGDASQGTHYVCLGKQAWKWVARLRKLRAVKAWSAKTYELAGQLTTED